MNLKKVLSYSLIFMCCLTLTACFFEQEGEAPKLSPSLIPPTLPDVTIRSPQGGSETSSVISLSGTCDPKVRTIEIAGGTPATASCSSEGTFLVEITLLPPSGVKTVTISQTNIVGKSSDSREFVLNYPLPYIAFLDPPETTFTKGSLYVQGICDSSIPIVNILGATPATTVCAGGRFAQLMSFSGADGAKVLTLSQSNSGGTGLATRTYFLDTTPPSLVKILINNGETYTRFVDVTLSLSASDLNPGLDMYVTNTSGCEFGGTWESYRPTKAWSLAQVNSLATVYVKFKDTVGNETSCIPATIVHDNILPAIAFQSPAENSFVGNTVTLAGSCENGLPVSIFGSGVVASTTTCSGGNFVASVNLSSGEGQKSVGVSQTDAAGNAGTSWRIFRKDTLPPTAVTYISPTTVTSTVSTSFKLEWNAATDESGVASYRVEIFRNGSCVGTPESWVSTVSSTFYSMPLKIGDNTLKVYARDLAGNQGPGVCSSNIKQTLASGDLDPSFIKSSNRTLHSVIVLSDDKILAVGNQNSNLVLVKYNADGSPDMTFGSGGEATGGSPTLYDPNKVSFAVLPNGKIQVYFQSAYNVVGMAQYKADGTLDSSFYPTGVQFYGVSNFGAGFDGFGGATRLEDGKVVYLMNAKDVNGFQKVFLFLVSENGTAISQQMEDYCLTSSENATGYDITSRGLNFYVSAACGYIFIAGYAASSSGINRLHLVRSTEPKVFNPTSIAVQSDGKINFGGGTGSSVYVIRLTSSFTLDFSKIYSISSYGSEISLYLTPTNSMYLLAPSANLQTTVASLSPTGDLVPSFGSSGKTNATGLSWYGSSSRGRHIGVQSDGKIIIVGEGVRRIIP